MWIASSILRLWCGYFGPGLGYLDFESRPVISQFGDLDENQVLVCTADVI